MVRQTWLPRYRLCERNSTSLHRSQRSTRWCLLAIAREVAEDGAIREAYRVIQPSRAEEHAKIWTIVEDEA